MHYKVGTRKSKLAMAQTQEVLMRLKAAYPEDSFETVNLVTTGDREQEKALDAIGTKGVFVDEIEKALLDGRISFAVHSMKDMPEAPAEGLIFSRAWKREDPRDVLILRDAVSLEMLPAGALIATGSIRRAFQLLKLRPDLRIVPIRGNVDTRIRRLHEGLPDGTQIDGIILAAAGLKRLGLEAEITQYLEPAEMIPAPAQGCLAIELRAEDTELLKKLNALCDPETDTLVGIEREFLKTIGGDCHLPIGAFAERITERHLTEQHIAEQHISEQESEYGGEDRSEADEADCKDSCPDCGRDLYRLTALYGNADGSRLASVVCECPAPEIWPAAAKPPKYFCECPAPEIRQTEKKDLTAGEEVFQLAWEAAEAIRKKLS